MAPAAKEVAEEELVLQGHQRPVILGLLELEQLVPEQLVPQGPTE